MTSVPTVKADVAAVLIFRQTLQSVAETLAVAVTTEAGITGLSKPSVASGTIDAILAAVQRHPATPEAVGGRYEPADAGDEHGAAEGGPPRSSTSGDDHLNANPATTRDEETSAGPKIQRLDIAEAAMARGPVVSHAPEALPARGPAMPPAPAAQAALDDPTRNGAMSREQAGHLVPRPRETPRARPRLAVCPRCGEDRASRPCVCQASRRWPFPRF